MIELAQTLLPNLPSDLNWVYGVFYIIETAAFFSLFILMFYLIIRPARKR